MESEQTMQSGTFDIVIPGGTLADDVRKNGDD